MRIELIIEKMFELRWSLVYCLLFVFSFIDWGGIWLKKANNYYAFECRENRLKINEEEVTRVMRKYRQRQRRVVLLFFILRLPFLLFGHFFLDPLADNIYFLLVSLALLAEFLWWLSGEERADELYKQMGISAGYGIIGNLCKIFVGTYFGYLAFWQVIRFLV